MTGAAVLSSSSSSGLRYSQYQPQLASSSSSLSQSLIIGSGAANSGSSSQYLMGGSSGRGVAGVEAVLLERILVHLVDRQRKSNGNLLLSWGTWWAPCS